MSEANGGLSRVKGSTWNQNVVISADVLTGLATLEPETVQCCVTSPPYWGLRDYGVEGQLGLEPTPDEYVAKMVEVFREVRRVLADDGVLWLNLGDSYAGGCKGSGGKGVNSPKQRTNLGAYFDGNTDFDHGLKQKDMVGIPWRVAFALQADGWWLRSDCIWAKPNPMPESVTDRPTKAHEYVFLLTKSARYTYDADAVRTETQPHSIERLKTSWSGNKHRDHPSGHHNNFDKYMGSDNALEKAYLGANLRTVWNIPTQPNPEAHFAAMPEKLAETCILAGSREGDTVLDPFAGTGTTLVVAQRLGRKGIGVELNEKYVEIIRRRTAQGQLL